MINRKQLRITPYAKILFLLNSSIPSGQNHINPLNRHAVNLYKIRSNALHLTFTQEEQELGQKKLREMGIPEGAHYICFHARDSAYLETLLDGVVYQKDQSWKYHDYRDSNIENYLLAVEELTKRGYYLLRMGSVVKYPITTTNPKIIDYATKHRSDFMDIFLNANCLFYFGTNDGLCGVPIVFKRPCAFVNVIPLCTMFAFREDHLHIPKKLWLRKKNRFMNTWEIFESGADLIFSSQQYDANGIDIIENTQEEIRDLTLEMEARLSGAWIPNQEDEDLQKRFWSQFKFDPVEFDDNVDYHKEIKARIGAHFLQENRDILL